PHQRKQPPIFLSSVKNKRKRPSSCRNRDSSPSRRPASSTPTRANVTEADAARIYRNVLRAALFWVLRSLRIERSALRSFVCYVPENVLNVFSIPFREMT